METLEKLKEEVALGPCLEVVGLHALFVESWRFPSCRGVKLKLTLYCTPLTSGLLDVQEENLMCR